MKLLFDQNRSPRLVNRLADLFPDSAHVHQLGIAQEPDVAVREFARRGGFVIVTKDADFSELCLMLGFPPKVVWIRRGNCRSTTSKTSSGGITETLKRSTPTSSRAC